MTDHSIKELERELDDAVNAAGMARRRVGEARKRLVAARITAQLADDAKRGIVPGCKVRLPSGDVYGFGGYEGRGWVSIARILYRLKRDGTVGKRRVHSFGEVELVE